MERKVKMDVCKVSDVILGEDSPWMRLSEQHQTNFQVTFYFLEQKVYKYECHYMRVF